MFIDRNPFRLLDEKLYPDSSDECKQVARSSLEDDVLERESVQVERNLRSNFLVGTSRQRRRLLSDCSPCFLHLLADTLY